MAEKRIHWKPEHKLAIAEAVIEHKRIYPGSSVISAVRRAQAVLFPPELQRVKLVAHSEVPWIDEYMDKVQQMRQQGKTVAQVLDLETPSDKQTLPEPQLQDHSLPAAPTPETDLQEAPRTNLRFREPLSVQSMDLKDLTSVWLDRFFDEYIAPRIEQRAEEMVAVKMAKMIEEIQVMRGEKGRVQVVVPETVKKQLKPKVLVLGLLGKQITEVKQRFGKELDLTLVGSDHNHNGLISLAKSHDVGVVMTRFVNHSQQDQVKANAPHCIMVSGATTDLGNILHSLVHEGMARVAGHHFGQKTFQ